MPASAPLGPETGVVRRRFSLVVAGEGVAIFAAVRILAGHSQWVPAVVCAAVGLHFIPLARLFRVPLYYGTGAALCLVATTTIIVGAAGAPAFLWQLLPGLGAASALWATSTTLLVATMARAPQPPRPAR